MMPLTPLGALLAIATAGAGFAFGAAYFAMLRRSLTRYGTAEGSSAEGHDSKSRGAAYRAWPAALTLGRLLCAAAFFTVAARLGALPLLAGFLGFIAARTTALRAARRIA